jgi:hypothetical protein
MFPVSILKKLKHQHVLVEYVHPNRGMFITQDGFVVDVLEGAGFLDGVLVLAVQQQSQIAQQVAQPAQAGMPLSQSNMMQQQMDDLVQYRFHMYPVEGICRVETNGGIDVRWNKATIISGAKLTHGTGQRLIYPLMNLHANGEAFEKSIIECWHKRLVALGLAEAEEKKEEAPVAAAPVAAESVA